jgi:uncharacterized protein Yka (UPF0111/DUF47 family)
MSKEELQKLHDKIDHLQKTVDQLSKKLYKRIKAIESEQEGPAHPIDHDWE